MSTPTRVDSEISFGTGALPYQLNVTSMLKDVLGEVQCLKDMRSPIRADRDQLARHIRGAPKPIFSQNQTYDQQDICDTPYHTNECGRNGVGRDQTECLGNVNRNNRLHVPKQNTRNADQNQSKDFPGRRLRFTQVKLPGFDGKEDWVTRITRFKVIADRYRWSEDDRLDQLFPKLEGLAADFPFSQLSPEGLNDYQELIRELTRRFRVVETARSFAAKLSLRIHKPNERVENFAA